MYLRMYVFKNMLEKIPFLLNNIIVVYSNIKYILIYIDTQRAIFRQAEIAIYTYLWFLRN